MTNPTQARNLTILCLLLTGLGGCEFAPSASPTKVQYMPDMADSPTTKAQETYINPPDGSVAMFSMIYPTTLQESEQMLRNPLPKEARSPEEETAIGENLAKGKELYNTFCIPCHGEDAKGKGSVTDKFPAPPDITVAPFSTKPEGSIFHTITFGSASGLMPAYGYATDPMERWQITLYVRKTLQGG